MLFSGWKAIIFRSLPRYLLTPQRRPRGPDHLLRSPLSSEERITFQPLATDRQFIFGVIQSVFPSRRVKLI